MARFLRLLLVATVLGPGLPLDAAAQERLCDTQFEDCRAPILDLIRNERVGIDVAFWFMEDSRYVTELVKAHNAGVPVRVLVDRRANSSKPRNAGILDLLRDGGLPMRDKFAGDILHFKMMLFHGQNMLEFSKANYSPSSFVPDQANVNYFDEAIFFTNDDNITNSFRRRFDDLWTNTSQYRNMANVTGPLVRQYPTYPIHSSMNFPPLQDFSNRAVSRYNRETQSIDAIVFRVTDHRQADAMISAVARGVPVRLITEPTEYRNPTRLWDAKHVDRMWKGGVQIKIRRHAGLMHEASVVMHGLGEVIFGSSNWTTASAFYQDEHNYFYNPTLGKPWFFQWFADQFEQKWNDTVNYEPFQPLPPGTPTYQSPPNVASGIASSATLTWDGGTWAHLYDIYFGATPNPPLVATNLELGSPETGQLEKYTVSGLQPGTTYYWRIVGKTWAQLAKSGPTWSFSTAGTPPGGPDHTPFGGKPWPIPGTLEAEKFDEGGEGLAYHDATTGNSGGAYRTTDVDIQATTDAGGGFNVGWTRAGEWLKYTVDIATTGTYQLEARVANIGTGAAFRIEVDGTDLVGPIAVPDTGAWQAWRTITTAGFALPAGSHVIRVAFASAGSGSGVGNFNWFRFVSGTTGSPSTPFEGAPKLLPAILPASHFDIGSEGVAYHDSTPTNSGGLFRTTGVDIGATNDSGSDGYYVGWTRAGEWLNYTLTTTETRGYALTVRIANLGSGAKFRIEVDGAPVTGDVAVPNTGAWDAWQTVSLPAIQLVQGDHLVRLVMVAPNAENSGAGNYGYLSFQ
jgi:phosphatidylserine/phosphatidylglycerophosphate/cardiolipin synthase-like enzyme